MDFCFLSRNPTEIFFKKKKTYTKFTNDVVSYYGSILNKKKRTAHLLF